MIDHIHGKIVFICDSCDDTLETGESSFLAAGEVRKAASWGVRYLHREFAHYCATCWKDTSAW